VQHLPGLYVLGAGIASLALGGAVRVATSSLGGAYLAWAYLRFVQTRNGVRGDLSDEFRLASFFPQPLQPPVDQLSAACTRLTGLGAASSGQQQPASYHYGLGGSVLPGTEDSDAARRRCATRAWGLLPGGSGLAAERCLSSSKAAGCEWLAPLPRHRVACRERGAKALEERLGMKKAGSAASVPPAAAAAAGSTAAQEAAPAAKAAAAAGDVEAGAAAETAS
jgi:hypothetical protein